MGLRGPKAKPTAMKIAEGFQPCRINFQEPHYSRVERPKPPAWLGPLGRRYWRKIGWMLAQKGIVRATDLPLLALLANTWEAVRENPDDAKACDRFLKLSREFGLTPSSRQNIREPNMTHEDALENFLNRQKDTKAGALSG